MVGIPSPFGSDEETLFDDAEEFAPEHIPDPGPFLADEQVLTGEDHLAVHEIAREVFEERTVYDMTFGYNLARLNQDTRHPSAGYRYAEERGGDVLRAEFTPTTPFCPQSHTLTIGSFRAWNGLADRHDCELVRVRVHPMHNEAERINDQLADLAARFRETGRVPDDPTPDSGTMPPSDGLSSGLGDGGPEETDYGPDAPF